jgi:hypothetical protein
MLFNEKKLKNSLDKCWKYDWRQKDQI